jgi:DNA-binding NarL/FixJ family response regulator
MPSSSPFEALPDRLFRLVPLLAAGKPNDEIACEAVLTLHTVEVYVSQLKELVGARDRVDLVLRGRDWLETAHS